MRFEPPYLAIGELVGDLTPAWIERMFADLAGLAEGRPFVLLLVEVSRVGSVSSEARAQALRSSQGVPMRGTAIVGASFAFRTLATLVHNAASLLGVRRDNPVRFFAGEAEARAWLRARAAELERGG